ncbi:YcxB family protein [Fodinicola acaciae]|uniref:YcxB family protein n=1 Tax=Fodinicola acaciae TaxID=2681555 RepID=UPI0013D3CECE|nr:YcxB family protein [Fodinicola acaciae]
MMIDVNYQVPLDRGYARALTRAVLGWRVHWSPVIGAVVALIGLMFLVPLRFGSAALFGAMLVVLGVAAIISPFVYREIVFGKLLRQPERLRDYRLSERGIRITTPTVQSDIPWSSVRKVRETGPILMLVAEAGWIPVPHSALTDADITALHDILADCGIRLRRMRTGARR